MSAAVTADVDALDDHVDEEIVSCLNLTEPKSFFLFAGAGSGKTRSLVKALDHVRANLADELRLHKPAVEARIRAAMAATTGDEKWTEKGGSKDLILEHRMAARRLGFDELFSSLQSFNQFRTGLLDGSLPVLTLFSGRILPLIDAGEDKFAVARAVRTSSPLLSAKTLRGVADEAAHLSEVQAAVTALQKIGTPDTATFGEILHEVARSGLFEIPEALCPAAGKEPAAENSEDDEDERSARDKAIDLFLEVPFGQIRPYVEYVTHQATFDTHQGVKGLEFPRVLVIMDDTEARGFLFKYEKLFGGGIGDDTTTASTRRLFYVTCSRAERSLCLVAYTTDPQRVRNHVISQGWFDQDEVQLSV